LRTTAAAESETYIFEDNLLLYRDTLIVPDINYLYTNLIREVYNQISIAYLGHDKTYQLLHFCYYWPEMHSDIIHFVYNCYIWRHADVPRDKTSGFLHPLLISDKPWQHVIINFKNFFINKNGFDNIYVVIDYLSKQAISISCQKTVLAEKIARLYIAFIYRYHKAPKSIISNRKLQFVSAFWREFIQIFNIQLRLSTANYIQTDSQTEIINQYLDQYLKPFVNYYQNNWSDILFIIDYAQLTLPHSFIDMSLYEL